MSAGGAVTLGELVGKVDCLEVRCRRCPRHGRLRLARLIADHGATTGLPDLAARLAADCPKAAAPDPAERCFVHFPPDAEATRDHPARSARRRPLPARKCSRLRTGGGFRDRSRVLPGPADARREAGRPRD